MRIRSIKPEFWRSRDITQLAVEDRLLFIGLWSYVDDNGVGRDEEPLIVSDLFAADMFDNPRETVARVSDGLARLSDAGLIVRYEAEGRPYMEIRTWGDHQRIDRPGKPRFPRSDDDRATITTSSRDSRESPLTGAVDQGAVDQGAVDQGAVDQGGDRRSPARPVDSPEFTEFWTAYPRKTNKGAARTAWDNALHRATAQEVINGAYIYANDPNLPVDQTKIPHASTWLNNDRWEDGPQPERLDHLTRGDLTMRREAQAAITQNGWGTPQLTYDQRGQLEA